MSSFSFAERTSINACVLGLPIKPTLDSTYSLFNLHWCTGEFQAGVCSCSKSHEHIFLSEDFSHFPILSSPYHRRLCHLHLVATVSLPSAPTPFRVTASAAAAAAAAAAAFTTVTVVSVPSSTRHASICRRQPTPRVPSSSMKASRRCRRQCDGDTSRVSGSPQQDLCFTHLKRNY